MADSFFLASSLLGGAIAGFLAAYLVFRGRIASSFEAGKGEAARENAVLQERVNSLEARAAEYRREIAEKEAKAEAYAERLSGAQERLSVTQTTLEKERTLFNEKIALLNNAKEELSDHF